MLLGQIQQVLGALELLGMARAVISLVSTGPRSIYAPRKTQNCTQELLKAVPATAPWTRFMSRVWSTTNRSTCLCKPESCTGLERLSKPGLPHVQQFLHILLCLI